MNIIWLQFFLFVNGNTTSWQKKEKKKKKEKKHRKNVFIVHNH